MDLSKPISLLWVLVTVVLLVAAYIFFLGPGSYDDFAKCLSSKEAKVYGASWCPHCKVQKELFGKSWNYVTYIECSPPGATQMAQICVDAGINSYPTWIFKDGSKVSRVFSLQELADKTGCALGK